MAHLLPATHPACPAALTRWLPPRLPPRLPPNLASCSKTLCATHLSLPTRPPWLSLSDQSSWCILPLHQEAAFCVPCISLPFRAPPRSWYALDPLQSKGWGLSFAPVGATSGTDLT